MKAANKSNSKIGSHEVSNESLENASGGYASYDPGFLSQQMYVIDEEEAKTLGISAGTFSRNTLARKLQNSKKQFSSSIHQRLAEQSNAADMDSILGDLGLKKR